LDDVMEFLKRLMVVCIGLSLLTISACGKKGDLKPPPGYENSSSHFSQNYL